MKEDARAGSMLTDTTATEGGILVQIVAPLDKRIPSDAEIPDTGLPSTATRAACLSIEIVLSRVLARTYH